MKLFHLTITLSFFAALLLPLVSHATGACNVPGAIQLSVYIPGITEAVPGENGAPPCYYLKKAPGSTSTEKAGSLPDYIAGIYYLGVRLGGLIALLMLMIGGAEWVFAQGSPEKISKSKERMVNAIVGLMLLLVSYTILNTINPQLVELKPLGLKHVEKVAKKESGARETVEELKSREGDARMRAQQANNILNNPIATTAEKQKAQNELSSANADMGIIAERLRQESFAAAQAKANADQAAAAVVAADQAAQTVRTQTESTPTETLIPNALQALQNLRDTNTKTNPNRLPAVVAALQRIKDLRDATYDTKSQTYNNEVLRTQLDAEKTMIEEAILDLSNGTAHILK